MQASYTPVPRSSDLEMRGMCSRLVLAWRRYRKTAPPRSATPANEPPTIPPMTGPDKPEAGAEGGVVELREKEGVIEGVSVVEDESVPAMLPLRVGDTVELGVVELLPPRDAVGEGDTVALGVTLTEGDTAGHVKDDAKPVALVQPTGYNSTSLGPVQVLRLVEGRG